MRKIRNAQESRIRNPGQWSTLEGTPAQAASTYIQQTTTFSQIESTSLLESYLFYGNFLSVLSPLRCGKNPSSSKLHTFPFFFTKSEGNLVYWRILWFKFTSAGLELILDFFISFLP